MNHVIVACARGWIGTRFHHQGRVKKTQHHKGGVDCLGLLAGVANELRLRGPEGNPLTLADETNYSHQPDAVRLKERLSELLMPVAEDHLTPGDIVLLRIDDSPQHLAIISDIAGGLGLIHAYAPARAVVEHQLDEYWRQRIEAAFRIL
jgi:cell wall-associated NlpC family hydrolase